MRNMTTSLPNPGSVLLGALLLLGLAVSPALAREWQSCIAELRGIATAKGIAGSTFDTALAGVESDPDVLKALDHQPEFTTPVWDYLAGLVDDERIADGQARLVQWADVLEAAEKKFGVDRHVIVAVWGVESDFGRVLGRRHLLRSLATLSCAGRRQAFFRGELLATLRIVQSGDIAAEALVGSWAGAFGQTQFMPSTYHRLAIDFDGDGRRDIVGSVPDALGSTANYLNRAGWIAGQPWGYEVRLPAKYSGPSGRRNKQPLATWRELGVRAVDGSALAGTGNAGLLLPAGAKGPAFLVFRNFDAIYAYNAAETYALAIAHLADRIRGGKPFTAAWPTDDPGLGRAERRELQQRLTDRGFDVGAADGIIGAKTRAAITAFQESVGMPPTGRAGQQVLRALRAPAQAPQP